MRALATLVAVLALAPRAEADTLVMRSEGRADKQARAKIEAAVLKLVKASGTASAGDITYGEAAVTAGCNAADTACKDEVLDLLAVDEVVAITADPKPGGIEVTVRRINKTGAPRTASAVVQPGQPDQLDAIAPLFGAAPPPAAVTPTPTPAATTPTPTPMPVEPAITTAPPPPEPQPAPPPVTSVREPAPSVVDTQPPAGPVDERPGSGRLPKIGMVAGGTITLVGLVFWASASSKANEIDGRPNRTRDDLEKIMALEDQADSLAATGNLLVLTGLVVGGVSTYYYLKGRRARSATSARLAPAVFGDGAGIAVTIGGSP